MKTLVKIAVFSLGTLGTYAAYANEISADFLKSELNIVHKQYLNGSAETGLYALEALARLLESAPSKTVQSEVGPNNLAFTYLRIGLLNEKAGNQRQAQMYFNKALGAYQGKNRDIRQLKEAVLHLDKNNS